MIRSLKARPAQNVPRGFTLLEVLLTVLLSMILLGGLWSLSNIYLRTFERGQDLVEQSQLLRAIQQQISDDLQGLALRPQSHDHPPILNQETPPSLSRTDEEDGSTVNSPESQSELLPNSDPVAASAGSGFQGEDAPPLPIYSLIGSEKTMQLILLREVFVESPEEESIEEVATEFLAGESSVPRLPNWRVVKYQFTPDQENLESLPDEEQLLNPPGLTRSETAWEDGIRNQSTEELLLQSPAGFDSSETDPTTIEALAPEIASDMTESAIEEEKQETEERVELPQVKTCRFRYFDGTTWLSSWNSTSSRTLPVAVELTLQIEPSGAALRKRLREEQQPATTAAAEDEENAVLQEPRIETESDLPLYRQVYFLINGGSPDHRPRPDFITPQNDFATPEMALPANTAEEISS